METIIKKVIIVLNLILVISCVCNRSRDNLTGFYKYSIYDILYELTINSDSSFIRFYHTGLALDTLKGTWKKMEMN